MSFVKKLGIYMLTCLPLMAEHGSTATFEMTVKEQSALALAPVRNFTIDFGWAEDESRLLYRVTEADGSKVVKAYMLSDGTQTVVQEKIPTWQKPKEGKVPRRLGYESANSSDDRWAVILRDGQVILKDRNKDTERVLAKADDKGSFTGTPYWSPDSTKFVIHQRKEAPIRQVHYVRSSPEKKLQPEYFKEGYPKPGDDLSISVPWIFFTDGTAPLEADRSLIENPFEIRRAEWRKDSQRLTFEWIERGFGKYQVIEMNAATRVQRVLVGDDSETFIYVYGYGFRRDLNGGDEILWNSERDGWNHLYLMDGKSGAVKKQLTQGNWVVKKVIRVDEEKRSALLKVSGYHSGQDPYFEHYVMVHFDSGKVLPLTTSPGHHDEPVFSPQGNYYVCRWSRIDHPPVYELRQTADGKLLKILSEADDRELKAKWRMPEPFVAKDRDGTFDIYGVIVKPQDFDATKKYPVIEYIYAGPHDAFVKKSWGPWIRPMHEHAAHGFIVVQIDGRGTAHRGKKFHDVCYKNLKDSGLPDRIAWMREAAKKWPQMDLYRVGIFGGSAGGQSALSALLFHGNFYKAGAADCGCHDNRMDKIWWNEQWMDWPVGPHYADNSNVTHAKNLQGALMLTVGEVDTNVDPSSTMQVVNALIHADKDFDFIAVPNGGHGVGESNHLRRKRVDFFQRHLGAAISMP